MDATRNPRSGNEVPHVRAWVRRLCQPLFLVAGCIASYLLLLWATHFTAAVDTAYKTLTESPRLGNPLLADTATRLLQLLPVHLERCLHWIYDTDVSTISGLLLFLFLFGVARGLWFAARNLAPLILSPGAPFGSQYKILWIQLGLTGTLVAFMLIGFGIDDSGTNASEPDTVSILVTAFGTAILSTLVAVVLAYIVAPAFQWLLRSSLAGISRSRDGIQRGSLEALVWLDRTVNSLKSAAETLDLNTKSLRRACREVPRSNAGPLGHLSRDVKTITEVLKVIGKQADANTVRLAGAAKESSGHVSRSIESLSNGLQTANSLLASNAEAQTELLTSLRALGDRDRSELKAILDGQNSIRVALDRIERQQEFQRAQVNAQACRFVPGRIVPGAPARTPLATWVLAWIRGERYRGRD